jgi:hypothetical protein
MLKVKSWMVVKSWTAGQRPEINRSKVGQVAVFVIVDEGCRRKVGRGRRKTENPSTRWMSIAEVAAHFRVSETTVSRGLGVFARLRRVRLTERRIVFVRTDVERLDRQMESAAVAITLEVARGD